MDYKVVPNFKYQCVLGMDAIQQFRLIVDGNANGIRMVYDDEIYSTAAIDLLSTSAWIDDDGCAAIKEFTKTHMALVKDFLKRELKVSKKELDATHLAKHTIDLAGHLLIKQKHHVRSSVVMAEMNKLMDKLIELSRLIVIGPPPVVVARKPNGTWNRLSIRYHWMKKVRNLRRSRSTSS